MTNLPELLDNSAPSVPPPESTTAVMADIYALFDEARAKGYDAEHDDDHQSDEFAKAAITYCAAGVSASEGAGEALIYSDLQRSWPFEPEFFQPSADPQQNYLWAIFFIITEIKRIRRLQAAEIGAATPADS